MIAFTLTPLAEAHRARNGYTDEDLLGAIPQMLSEDDQAGAVEQIDAAYRWAGGWRDSKGNMLSADRASLRYPGDPPRQLIASARLRDEQILFFNGAWIAVVQPDGSYRVARID